MVYGSLFSGIEAATVAWEGLGWSAAWLAEIEPFPAAVLAHHYPQTPNLGDVTKIQWKDYAGSIDLVVGGAPCQSFSIAGRRLGLADPRGNLALVMLGIIDQTRPRWMVFENVPGLLSADGGRAFGIFLGTLGELGYGFAYRVLDAQYFGVPQRRRRVFVVGYLGDWRYPAAVLFEPESLCRNPAPGRETGPDHARALTRGFGAGGPDDNAAQAGHLVGTLTRGLGSGGYKPDDLDKLQVAKSLMAHRSRLNEQTETLLVEGDSAASTPDLPRLRAGCGRGGETAIAHTLRGEWYDASEDGTGRGKPLVVNGRQDQDTREDLSHPLGAMDKGHAVARETTGDTSAVRRLTPRECERLQGFPDDYTRISWRSKDPADCPDGPRYRALGNSMAVPVMRWIGARIEKVEGVIHDL